MQPTVAVYTDAMVSTSYVVAQPTVIAAAAPASYSRSKRSIAPICACCLFMVAIIVCATLIPFPGQYYGYIVSAAQGQVFYDGHFIERVDFSSHTSPVNVYAFSSRPPLDSSREFSRTLHVQPEYEDYQDNTRFDLYADSFVKIEIAFDGQDTCVVKLYMIRGTDHFNSIVEGRTDPSFYGEKIADLTQSGEVTRGINSYDQYYFMFVNDNFDCVPTPATATFTVTAASFSLSNAEYSCNTTFCVDHIPYGTYRYYVLEAPIVDDDEQFQLEVTSYGLQWAYWCLYIGLGLGMILCIGIAAVVSRRKAAEAEAAAEEDRAALLHSHPTTTTYVYGSTTLTPAMPAIQQSVPPPYQLKYDPTTGMPISQ